MKQATAIRMFESGKAYCEAEHPDEVDWANSITPETFKNLRSKRFLSEYCWVVYASGFKVSTIEAIFPDLKTAFKDFELEELAKMKSTKPVRPSSTMNVRQAHFSKAAKLLLKRDFQPSRSAYRMQA